MRKTILKCLCICILSILMCSMDSTASLLSEQKNSSQSSVLPNGVELYPQDDISSVERVFPNYPHNQDLSQIFTYKLGLDYGGLEVGNPSLRQERATYC